MSFIYSILGLTLSSDVPLPCLRVQDWSANVDVCLAESTQKEIDALCLGATTHVEQDSFWRCVVYESGAAVVCWKDYFDFVVSGDGRQVLWRRNADVPDEVLFTYLLGQALSFSLLAQGVEPLHATSVLVNGVAVAFLGDSGEGKSTLAAALLERGHRLLTDDVLVVKFEDGRAVAYPSVARIKLTPESADAVFRGRRSVPMNPLTAKMILPLRDDQYATHAARLSALYVIAHESQTASVSIRRLNGPAELLTVIQHTFNDSVLHSARVRQQFDFARRLVESVGIKTLSYPKNLTLLPLVADAILADVHRS